MSATDARIWWRIGWLSFGGPAGQIAMMQRMLVEELRWIEPQRFLAALNFCMLLPGPEAQQLATWIGWRRGGWKGAIVAGGLFVLPGALVMLVLGVVYVRYGRVPLVEALLFGVKCAIVVVVVEALLRIARRALVFAGAPVVAFAAFLALYVVHAPFPAIVALAALVGALSTRSVDAGQRDVVARGRTDRRLVLATALAWLLPLGVLVAVAGDSVVARIALLYSELALVTFGGAYAVLTHIADVAVAELGWITPLQMADGLGLAETTPGPLILVLQFVAFVAAYQADGGASIASGVAASIVAVWMLFVPSFLFIFLGAPHLDRINADARLRRALAFVTAAVVGVIAHLSLWFALHVVFGVVSSRPIGPFEVLLPSIASADARAIALVAIAALALFGLRTGLVRTLAITAGAALSMSLAGGSWAHA